MATTGFVWNELYAWHDPGRGAAWLPPSLIIEPSHHVDTADSRRRARNLLDVTGVLDRVELIRARPPTEEELLRFHTLDFLNELRELSAGEGGDAGELSKFGAGGFEIAALAAGGCIAAVEQVMAGSVTNAYALVRPAGHHAVADSGRGHCVLANVTLAAKHAQAALGAARIAILDWDAHHGNGTESAFYDDPDVLTISIHQDRAFPIGSGRIEDGGTGAGVGANINIPLPPGSGPDSYRLALDELALPAIRDHRPDLVMVASGLDASQLDPNSRMMMTSAGYRSLTWRVMSSAAELCDGRLVMCHEGGYSEPYVPFCVLAIMEELTGQLSGVDDPFLEIIEAGDLGLLDHQREAVAAAKAAHERESERRHSHP